MRDVVRIERDFNSITEEHKKRLKYDYKERINSLKEAINNNYKFISNIVSPYSSMFKFYLNVRNIKKFPMFGLYRYYIFSFIINL